MTDECKSVNVEALKKEAKATVQAEIDSLTAVKTELEQKVATLEGEKKVLEEKLKVATDSLDAIAKAKVKAETDAIVSELLEITGFTKDELEKMSLDELKIVKLTSGKPKVSVQRGDAQSITSSNFHWDAEKKEWID